MLKTERWRYPSARASYPPKSNKLNAFGLGQLTPDEANVIEKHISECEPCCETIADLASDDTFVNLLQSAEQELTDQTIEQGLGDRLPDEANERAQGVPAPLADHARYEIVGLIGKGGMGDVYMAQHRKMKRKVALKVINRKMFRQPEAVHRFHREVEAAAQLSHPHIVTSHDADQAGDFHFMVMEYVDGVDLSQVVRERGPLSIAQACDYVRQAALGLQHAHERGMVHRDIKPHNLMVTADGTVKILDFGLASLAPEPLSDVDEVASDGDLTLAGSIMGTPDFISPEQATDARQADVRSDIYSLGATLYFLLTGRAPFAEGTVVEKLKRLAENEPESIKSARNDVPVELDTIVMKMLAKNPDSRYQAPAEVADALQSLSPAKALRQGMEPQTHPKPRRKVPTSLPLAAVATLFITSLLAGLIYYIQTNHGVVRVEVTDPSIEVSINNQTITMKDGDEKALTIRPGEQTLIVRKADSNFSFETDRFQLRRGDRVAFKVEYIQGEIVVHKDGKSFARTPMLVGEWRGKHDANQGVRLTFHSNGTFEMLGINPHNPEQIHNRTTGKYTADFSVTPAQLDLDGTIVYPAYDPKLDAAPKGDTTEENGSVGTESVGTGPKRERAVKHKFEVIIELIDADTLQMSNLETDARPSTFGEEALILHRQRVAKDTSSSEGGRSTDGLELSPELQAGLLKSGQSTSEFQKKLYATISQAAGIPNDQWEKVAKSSTASTKSIQGMPLSLLLLTTDDARVFGSHFTMTGTPQMKVLHNAMSPSSPHGYVSLIQPEYITKTTLDIDQQNKRFQGTVWFQSPDLYTGQIEFALKLDAGRLKLIEFALPKAELKIVRDEAGLWIKSEIKPETPRVSLDGKWKVIQSAANGEAASAKLLENEPGFFVFSSNTLVMSFGKIVNQLEYRLDTSQQPMEFDTTYGDEKSLGIFDLQGDTLRVCLSLTEGGARPKTFDTKPGSGLSSYVLKRVPKEAAANRDQQQIQGPWQVVYMKADGEVAPPEIVGQLSCIFDGDSFTTMGSDKVLKRATFALDPSTSPASIDVTAGENDKRFGIYELQGKSLRICISNTEEGRPKDFGSAGSGTLIMHLRRMQSADKPAKEAHYPFESIKFKSQTKLDNGKVRIVFQAPIETMWFCPGANAKVADDHIELTFVRALYNKRPQVQYPASPVRKDVGLEKSIEIDPQGKAIYAKSGDLRILLRARPR